MGLASLLSSSSLEALRIMRLFVCQQAELSSVKLTSCETGAQDPLSKCDEFRKASAMSNVTTQSSGCQIHPALSRRVPSLFTASLEWKKSAGFRAIPEVRCS